MAIWLDDILSGINLVSKVGSPGRIIVFGKQALPILTGQNEEDVVMAAAELCKGRIFVFSHTGYGHELKDLNGSYPNSTLYKKVRNWVTRREISDNANILNLDSDQDVANIDELKAYDILLSTGKKESIPSQKVEDYVKTGGAFIHATTPWGYLQLNPSKKPYELAYVNILLKVGISYSKGICVVPEPGFSPKLNKASGANISKYLQEDIGKLINQIGLAKQLKELPVKYRCPFIQCLDKNWGSITFKVVKAMKTGKIKTYNAGEKQLLDFWILGYELLDKKSWKAFGINDFPGDFETRPNLTEKTVTFSSTLKDHFFTSCYAPAGTEVNLTVSKVTNSWLVFIGAHFDLLKSDQVNRWPKIYVQIEIDKLGTYNISSPFGGSMYFLSPKKGNSDIEVLISNIVICPRFDLVTGGKPWKESRNDPGLWADISGRYATITLPSSSIRYYDDPTQIMELYDKLLICYHDLRGTQVDKERKMWIVTDIQTFAGYMHTGYPIVTHLDVADPKNNAFLLNSKAFVTSEFWGIYHEMAHNVQQEEYTFEGTFEVTVNIFTLYGMYVVGGFDSWTHPWLLIQREGAIDYLKGKPDFEIWKNEPGIALYVYAQLAHTFSWDAYKRIFRRYQALQINEKPQSNQDKIDMWYLIFSQETKCNLSPIALFWGIPLSNNVLQVISSLNLKPFLPDDEVTKEVPNRVKVVMDSFPSLVRKNSF